MEDMSLDEMPGLDAQRPVGSGRRRIPQACRIGDMLARAHPAEAGTRVNTRRERRRLSPKGRFSRYTIRPVREHRLNCEG